jgi:anthraniloyl-CoA monooxygenase
VAGGVTGADSVEIARAFAAAGADAIDVSTGQTSPNAAPRHGRGWQVPYAERIRHAVGVPVIAVGGISTADDVNSLLLAGRADICAVGRAFLHDPAWALHAAAEQGFDVPWPVPYEAGRRPPPGARPADRALLGVGGDPPPGGRRPTGGAGA